MKPGDDPGFLMILIWIKKTLLPIQSKQMDGHVQILSFDCGESKMEPAQNKTQQAFCLKSAADIAVYQAFMSYKCALGQVHLSAFTKYACLALQGEFLLNATVGIAAFSDLENGRISIVFCTIGSICAIASSFLAYISQRFFLEYDSFFVDEQILIYFQIPHNEWDKASHLKKLKSRISLSLTILTSVISLICFVCGLCIIL